MLVAGEAGQDDTPRSRGLGDRRCPRVVLSRSSIFEAGPVIAELAQHPGAEDHTKSRQTRQDLGVRVTLKMLLQLRPERRDAGVQRPDLLDQRGDHRSEGLERLGIELPQGAAEAVDLTLTIPDE